MTDVQEVASLHEKAVQAVATGELESYMKPRKRKSPTKTKLVRIKPRQDVWIMAKKLADGDIKRLLVKSEDCVIVMNVPNQFRK